MKQKNKRRQTAAAKQAGSNPTLPKLPMQAQPESALALPETTSSGDNGYYYNKPYDPANGDEPYLSDEDGEPYYQDDANGVYPAEQEQANGSRKKSKKKRKNKGQGSELPYDNLASGYPPSADHAPPPPPPPPPSSARPIVKQRGGKDHIWNTSTQQERERIKEFWLGLGEEERKSLVKIEKEAVLRKMKEQQKHSCSCTVCGRKRTAIEEELEVLYDAYYEELEQIDPNHMLTTSAAPRVRELADDEELDLEDDELDEEYSDEYEEDEDYSDEDSYPPNPPPGPAADLFNFGQHLTVKGGILTVADDLLQNDGKKFIEMMEQLAERRMQREEEAQYAAAGMSHPSHQNSYGHNHGVPEDDEYDDEEDEEYDSQDEYDEEEAEMDTMTEEQRMQEGRRMFQIFAARMFEQRVLQAYREKVATERQLKLLEELQEEDTSKQQKEAKKARDAQKKKEKKKAQQQAKAEEKARKEAEVAEQDAAKKAEDEKRQEEQRRKKEEQRLKREAEKKAQEEEKQKKEAERTKRQQQERERQQEAERRAREQKASEKKAREEAKKKEREEREAKEREAREKKAQEERERKEREAKEKEEWEAKERARREEEATRAAAQLPSLVKRPSGPAAVPIPPGLHKQPSHSPQVPVATPAIPKAPTPSKPRQNSRQGSHGSSPKTPQVGPGKSISPNHPTGAHSLKQPVQILKPPTSQPQAQAMPPQPTSPSGPVMPPPPPGIHNGPFGQPQGLGNYPHSQGPMMHGMTQRAPMAPGMPMFPHQTPQMPGAQFGRFPPPLNGMPPISSAGMIPIGRGFSTSPDAPTAPPGFQTPHQPIGTPQVGNQLPSFNGASRESLPSHSRQQSGSDKPYEQPPIAPPTSRPAPIQRPSSVKPHEVGEENATANADVEDLTKHLGSKALLDDVEDEPIEPNTAENRRASNQAAPGLPRASTFASPFSPPNPLRTDPFGANTWGTPGLGGFPAAMPTASTWSSTTSPHQGWSAAAFGPIGGGMAPGAAPQSRIQKESGIPRQAYIRKLVCDACRRLSSTHPPSDGWFDINILNRQVDTMRLPNEQPVGLGELHSIIENNKAGSALNGGGKLDIKREPTGRTLVKFEDGQGTIGGGMGHEGGALGGLGVSGMGSPSQGNAQLFGGLGARTFLA